MLLDILNEINSDVDYEICDTLIDDGIFSSFDIVSLVGELNDAFDIDITPVDIVPENFNFSRSYVGDDSASAGLIRKAG